MRTTMVNPRRRRRKTTKRKRRNVSLSARKTNPRRRRKTTRRKRRNYSAAVGRRANPRRKVRRRRVRRRNAGIRPFVKSANPLIQQNPRKRRRKRSNPKLNIQRAANKILVYASGSAIATGADILAVSKIENVWARNAARLVAAMCAPMFLKGDMAHAFSGAMLYPAIEDLAIEMDVIEPEADLNLLAADLEAALEDYDDYGYQNNPTPGAIW